MAELARRIDLKRPASLYESAEFKAVRDQMKRMVRSGVRAGTPDDANECDVPEVPVHGIRRGVRHDDGSVEAVA